MMPIPLEGMVGYIRSRKKPGRKGEVELYIDPHVKMKQTANGPVVSVPEDCAGIIYGNAEGENKGKLRIEYPEE